MIPLIPLFIGLFVWSKLSKDKQDTTAGAAVGAATGIGFAVIANFVLIIGAAYLGWMLYKKR